MSVQRELNEISTGLVELTADELLYIKEHRNLKLDASHDFQKDPKFQEWIKKLTNDILDGIFPREVCEENK